MFRPLLVSFSLTVCATLLHAENTPERDDAAAIARWLNRAAIDASGGIPSDTRKPAVVEVDLGSGNAGVVLFWIAMHRSDPDGGHLDRVRRSAGYLASNLRQSIDPGAPGEWTTGLYGPIAGAAFALHEAYRVTADPNHRDAALHLVDVLHRSALRDASGASWGLTHDVLTGAAGTGLFLLYAADQMKHSASCELARDAGRKLLLRAIPDSRGGITWKPSYEARFILPNFSHGVAGIAYFLASLYETTGERAFLTAALGGAEWLQVVGDRSDGGFRVFYGWPDPKWARPFDIGWAHGPAGTARLFYKLWQITGEAKWLELVHAAARSLRASGLPDTPKPEYGTAFELNQRFGTAGVARFFLDLYSITNDPADLLFARRLARDIVAAGTRESSALHWETRRPGFMEGAGEEASFTGYFYGAAGYGLLLLGIDGVVNGREMVPRLPDDPFGLE